ncbi:MULTISPECIES: type II secretion system protein [Massilia]|uniref:Uncharacterized protein n=1 Tax=Massilia aurea TaxID=373040 RepID=A0A422QCW5_9BURK|nr:MULTISPECIES: type II secretion system protein [Massilia]MDY0964109.1 type II secretion system protein [Massilia sp. CFBP9026]RNF27817.1 hypothetical protein NM04_26600 [Massilia aurea]
MNISFNKKAQSGFTLIELIVVIVILGILAATALPKFASLSGDARMASLQGAKGAISSASAMVHGKWLINNTPTVTVENSVINIVNGYPSTATIAIAAGLTDDYTIVPNGQDLIVRPKNLPAALNDTCKVTYSEATAARPAQVVIAAGPCE